MKSKHTRLIKQLSHRSMSTSVIKCSVNRRSSSHCIILSGGRTKTRKRRKNGNGGSDTWFKSSAAAKFVPKSSTPFLIGCSLLFVVPIFWCCTIYSIIHIHVKMVRYELKKRAQEKSCCTKNRHS